jgi:hypothetical protein
METVTDPVGTVVPLSGATKTVKVTSLPNGAGLGLTTSDVVERLAPVTAGRSGSADVKGTMSCKNDSAMTIPMTAPNLLLTHHSFGGWLLLAGPTGHRMSSSQHQESPSAASSPYRRTTPSVRQV